VWRLSGSIGAEILGIDLAAKLGRNVIAEIHQIWQAALKSPNCRLLEKFNFALSAASVDCARIS
jgi:hypothetical protein